MLRKTLKWNVYDIGNALTGACCVCSWGVHWPCRMSLLWENGVVKESKHFRGDA